MKKTLVIAMLCLLSAVMTFAACGQTASNEFNLINQKPWSYAAREERMVYDYTMTDRDGNLTASGIYTVTISTTGSETTFNSSLTISYTDGQGTVSMQSRVVMDATSLYPKYSSKTMTDSLNNTGYELIMNYEELTSSMTFRGEDGPRQSITLYEPGQEVYDNEQLYQIVRAADNLGEQDSTGTFSIINGVDTYLNGEVTSYLMIYSVGESTTVHAEGMENKYGVNADGNIPCRPVTIKINSDRSGSGTVVDYAISQFEGGCARVPVRISRSQYSTSSFDVAYRHTYTLSDYSAI